MRKPAYIGLMIALVTLMITGCIMDNSDRSKPSVSEAETVEAVPDRKLIPIAYAQLAYTKTSPDYVWEFRTDNQVDQDIQQLYEAKHNRVPGASVLKETDEEIYLMIHAGKHPSSEGFEIVSMSIAEEDGAQPASLFIELSPSHDEVTEGYPGEANVTALIRMNKKDWPEGFVLRSIRMTGV